MCVEHVDGVKMDVVKLNAGKMDHPCHSGPLSPLSHGDDVNGNELDLGSLVLLHL